MRHFAPDGWVTKGAAPRGHRFTSRSGTLRAIFESFTKARERLVRDGIHDVEPGRDDTDGAAAATS